MEEDEGEGRVFRFVSFRFVDMDAIRRARARGMDGWMDG
jgi:hypothetical protein